MGNRTRTLTCVRWLGAGLPSESQFFNFGRSLQEAVSCLTDSKFGFPFRKHRRLGLLNVGLSSTRLSQSKFSRS